jgi:hypothetical protein
MELNLFTILYLFFRLAPFIVVCYFSLGSLFNQDLKGLIYLVGLLFSCFATFLVGQTIPISFSIGSNPINPLTKKNVAPVCNLLTIGKDGSFSRIPLGISILCFTLIYLVAIIAKHHLEMMNLPTLIFFPVLILGDLIWNMRHECYAPFGIILAMAVGSLMGWAWSTIVGSLNKPDLFYLNVGSNQSVCQRPSKQLFKCTFANPAISSATATPSTKATSPAPTTEVASNNSSSKTPVPTLVQSEPVL